MCVYMCAPVDLLSVSTTPAVVFLCLCSLLQSVSVLPLKAYNEFQSYLSMEYSHLVSVLEPSVSARWKVRGGVECVCVCLGVALSL